MLGGWDWMLMDNRVWKIEVVVHSSYDLHLHLRFRFHFLRQEILRGPWTYGP